MTDCEGASRDAEGPIVARLTERARRIFGTEPEGEVWIGDDAASVSWADGPLLLAVDTVVGGVHADLSLVSRHDLGWKAMAASLSDLAAMGGRPRHALVALSTPPDSPVGALCEGLLEASSEWHCPIVGGDLSTAPEIVVSVTVTGTVDPAPGSAPPGSGRLPATAAGRAVTRDGASPGDLLFVTGPLGGSATGLRLLRAGRGEDPGRLSVDEEAAVLRHRRPRARVREGTLARESGATAMIDVSDGLSLDLDRLARASGVGLALGDVPVFPGASLVEALGGGEDYELVVAVPPSATARLRGTFTEHGLDPPLPIGRCEEDRRLRRLDDRPLPVSGYQHPLRW